LLVASIVEELAERGTRKLRISDEAVLHLLKQYDWPGNVRELRNVVERMVLLCKTDDVRSEDIAFFAKKLNQRRQIRRQENQEVELIRKVLVETKGNKGEAAKILGMDRSTLWRKIKRHGGE